jgi:cytochrome c
MKNPIVRVSRIWVILAFGLVSLLALAPLRAETSPPSDGDAKAGALKFAVCAACHARTAGGPARIGPDIIGVYGLPAGVNDPNFTYSPALKASRLTWNDRTLDAWLSAPASLVPGTKMTFAGVVDPKTRADLIAYVKSLGARK